MQGDDEARTDPADAWAVARWEGAEMETLLAGARMPFAERLKWLEEMGRLSARLARSRGESSSRPL